MSNDDEIVAEPNAIKKTLVWTDDNNLEKVDTIEYDNKLWLVALWRELPALKRKRPARLIRLDCLPHEKNGKHPDVDYTLSEILPKFLFDPEPLNKQEIRFEVVEEVDIWFEYQTE
jgi:hypothetical protein